MTDDDVIGWIGIMVVRLYEMEVPPALTRAADDASSYSCYILLENYITFLECWVTSLNKTPTHTFAETITALS